MGDNDIPGLIGAVGAIVTLLSLMFLYIKTLMGRMSIVDFTTEAVKLVIPSPTVIILGVFLGLLAAFVTAIIVVLKRT